MTFSEAAMIMMSGGNAVVSNMVDIIDKMPTLCTYTAGEYLFEFKFASEPLWYASVGGTYDGGASITARIVTSFVCRKGSKIICVRSMPANSEYGNLYKIYFGNGDEKHNIIRDIQMSVSLDTSTYITQFKLTTYFIEDVYLNDKLYSSDSRYRSLYLTTYGNNASDLFFTNLPQYEFTTEYVNAVKALEESISE